MNWIQSRISIIVKAGENPNRTHDLCKSCGLLCSLCFELMFLKVWRTQFWALPIIPGVITLGSSSMGDYCAIWSAESKISTADLTVIRMTTFSNYLAHTVQLFLDLNILNVFKVYMMQICLFTFKVYNSTYPEIISKSSQRNHEIHLHQTRLSNNFRIPLFRFVNLQRSFMYTGVTNLN